MPLDALNLVIWPCRSNVTQQPLWWFLQEIPDAREAGLGHLCEFIEDCEFTFLSVQVLHLLGQEGPTTKEPARYVLCSCPVKHR